MKEKLILIFIMFVSIKSGAQSSLSLSGYWPPGNAQSAMNSFESNPSAYSVIKDWGLTAVYGSEFSNDIKSNLYLVSLSKRLAGHALSLRYTPGYQKEFLFENNQVVAKGDSSIKTLNSRFLYKEIFGLGYSYKISEKINSGFTFRYFTQEFNSDALALNYPTDTTTSFSINTISEKENYWKGDIGINYFISNNLSVSLSSINLLTLSEEKISAENEDFKLKKEKMALIGISYFPSDLFNLNFLYETGNSFQAGFSGSFRLFRNGNLSLGTTLFHDDYQSPYIAGINPGICFSTDLFNVTISGIKYFSDRNISGSFTKFRNTGIDNIINNQYSFDKLILSFGFTLNTLPERLVEFVNVEVLKEIYPTFTENYLNTPFAAGLVVNLSEKQITVKPSSRISGINNEAIYSPFVLISPKDTAKVFFYTIIPDTVRKEKTGISNADFYLTTVNETPDDEFQKPILVNSRNAWDGKVINLRYFIKNDYDLSMDSSKEILNKYKIILDTLSEKLVPFYKSKIIFDNLVKELVYVSDPRASSDLVQFPHETLKLKGGDCDDLTVCFSSLLESVGIETAIVDYKSENEIGHVNILINTGLSPAEAGLITRNDQKYLVRKSSTGTDEVWIPVETTSLTNFETAWETGSVKFYNDAIGSYGIAKGKVEIIDVY
ncbi:MAG TPA: hypothetical protein VMT35_07375 [Ignavibacteriaceae bacterium]|nr:hypothetical protein [Ignavibacteriaceae bacterium]